jgi:GGDEF domain-containing protein
MNDVSVSVGIGYCSSGGITYDELYGLANEAMYKVKEKGGGCYEIMGRAL